MSWKYYICLGFFGERGNLYFDPAPDEDNWIRRPGKDDNGIKLLLLLDNYEISVEADLIDYLEIDETTAEVLNSVKKESSCRPDVYNYMIDYATGMHSEISEYFYTKFGEDSDEYKWAEETFKN